MLPGLPYSEASGPSPGLWRKCVTSPWNDQTTSLCLWKTSLWTIHPTRIFSLSARAFRRPIFHTLQEQERQSSSPDPFPTAPSPGLQDSQQSRELAPRPILQWEELIHMGPSSNHSGGSSHVGTSLSLGSHSHCPSEMSSIVAHFFPETVAAGVHRHPTQRKRDTAYTSARLLPPSSRRGSSQEHIAFP